MKVNEILTNDKITIYHNDEPPFNRCSIMLAKNSIAYCTDNIVSLLEIKKKNISLFTPYFNRIDYGFNNGFIDVIKHMKFIKNEIIPDIMKDACESLIEIDDSLKVLNIIHLVTFSGKSATAVTADYSYVILFGNKEKFMIIKQDGTVKNFPINIQSINPKDIT